MEQITANIFFANLLFLSKTYMQHPANNANKLMRPLETIRCPNTPKTNPAKYFHFLFSFSFKKYEKHKNSPKLVIVSLIAPILIFPKRIEDVSICVKYTPNFASIYCSQQTIMFAILTQITI